MKSLRMLRIVWNQSSIFIFKTFYSILNVGKILQLSFLEIIFTFKAQPIKM